MRLLRIALLCVGSGREIPHVFWIVGIFHRQGERS